MKKFRVTNTDSSYYGKVGIGEWNDDDKHSVCLSFTHLSEKDVDLWFGASEVEEVFQ